MLQDPLHFILFTFIDYDWWCLGLHAIVLVGSEESYVENVVDSSESLPVTAAGEVQAVGSLPYPLLDSKRPYKPVLQFPGSLQSQVLSTQ